MAGRDFIAPPAEIQFAPGERTKSISIPILDNAERNPDRGFRLRVIPDDEAAVRIWDDDLPPRLVDPTFDPGTSIGRKGSRPRTINALLMQPDGRVVIAGQFEQFGGTERVGIARLNPDGSLDSTYEPQAVRGDRKDFLDVESITAPAAGSGGQLIVGGRFHTSNSSWETRASVAILNADGSLDVRFSAGTNVSGAYPYSEVKAVASQADGKVIVGGTFPAGLVRLNENGSRDMAFLPVLKVAGIGATVQVNTLRLQADGKIVIGGRFDSINGVTRVGLARLNSDGSLDATFNANAGVGAEIISIVPQPDGKWIGVGGLIKPEAPANVFRLQPDGALDSTFRPPTGDALSRAWSLALQPDGKILIGGFTEDSDLQTTDGMLVRLHPDGALDSTFDVPRIVGTSAVWLSPPHAGVEALAVQPDGRVIMAGDFDSVDGIPRIGLARLLPSSSSTSDFSFSTTQQRAAETSTRTTVVVERRGDASNAASVNYTVAGRTAMAGADFEAQAGTLAFAPNVRSRDITISLRDDALAEPDEEIQIQLTNPSGGASLGFPSTTALRILDNERPGSLDTSFDAGFIPLMNDGLGWSSIQVIAWQPPGSVFIAGHLNGFFGSGVAKLNADGSRDPSFAPQEFIDAHQLAIQSDGKILAGWGSYTRLNPDGTIDHTFRQETQGTEILLVLPDGKLVVGGTDVWRLNPDGSIDKSFKSPSPVMSQAYAAALQTDGKLVIAGDSVVRLNADGSRDAGFSAVSVSFSERGNAAATALALQPDGKIVIGGSFTAINAIPRNGIARLNPDGSLDTTFATGRGLNVATVPIGLRRLAYSSLALLSDGKLIVGGSSTAVDGVPRNGIARLNADGSLDHTFDPGSGVAGSHGSVWSIALQPDGQILIAGNFSEFNGVPRFGVARLNGDRGSAITLRQPRFLADGSFAVFILGQAGWTYRVETSTDLVN